MPFVAQESTTGQLLARRQTNKYGLAYYGVFSWETEEEAEAGLLQSTAEQGNGPAPLWSVVEVEESVLKLANVKLANDDGRAVFWSPKEGRLHVVRSDAGEAEAAPGSG